MIRLLIGWMLFKHYSAMGPVDQKYFPEKVAKNYEVVCWLDTLHDRPDVLSQIFYSLNNSV